MSAVEVAHIRLASRREANRAATLSTIGPGPSGYRDAPNLDASG